MKFLILLAVILLVAWWTFGRRGSGQDAAPPPARKPGDTAAPQAMLSCAHCSVHLPRSEALFDADQRPFCSEAHRLAGPHGTRSGDAG